MHAWTLKFLGWVLLCSMAFAAPTEESAGAQPASGAPTAAAPRAEARAARVHVIPVHGQIGSAVLYVIRRGIKEAIEEKADAIVLDLNTPGGELGATLEIMEAIAKFPGQTFTFVNTEAMSAGAFIASSTHEIWFAPDGIMGAAAPVSMGGQEVDATMKQKLVSYLRARVRATSEGKGYRGEVVSAMIDADREFKIDEKVIKPKGELLSLTATEAAAVYGSPPQPLLSAGTAKNVNDLVAQRFGATKPVLRTLEMTWSETLAAWLNSITPLLLGVGMLALFIEFKTPGFGVFGIVGIALLAVVFLSSYVAGLSGHEPALFFALGLGLLAVEIFVFPGTVLAGLAGAALVLGSLVWAMADLWPNEPISTAGLSDALVAPLVNLGLGLLISIGLGAALLRFLPHGWVWDKLVLNAAAAATAQGSAAPDAAPRNLVGQTGRVVTALRPCGQVEIQGRRYEARVQVGSLPIGATVVVLRRTDFELIVQANAP